METLEYSTVDKAGWGDGPWLAEPDKIQWADEATGMPCLILRGPAGALCGYVGVSAAHPWHSVEYNGCFGKGTCSHDDEERWGCDRTPEWVVDVHGGLTYSAACGHGDEASGICHIPAAGEPDDVWWFGFDCHHYLDVGPAHDYRSRQHGWEPFNGSDSTYRTVAYVKGEVARLAGQLAAVSS